MAVVYSKVLLFDPPLIYTAPDICVFGAVYVLFIYLQKGRMYFSRIKLQKVHGLRRIPLTRAYGFIGVYRNDEIF